MDAAAVVRAYHAACARLGFERRRFHHLRPFAATAALEAGNDPCAVSRMLGHASITTTAKAYGHVTPAMRPRTAELMDFALG